MNFMTPRTHRQLVKQRLQKDEALTIYELQDMNEELFPTLFKDAFSSKKHNILRQMVAAWPFSYLPVGALMKTPDLETLKAVLDGLDLLMRQKDRPRLETPREHGGGREVCGLRELFTMWSKLNQRRLMPLSLMREMKKRESAVCSIAENRCRQYAMSLSQPLPSRNGFKGLCVVGQICLHIASLVSGFFFPFDPQEVETTSA